MTERADEEARQLAADIGALTWEGQVWDGAIVEAAIKRALTRYVDEDLARAVAAEREACAGIADSRVEPENNRVDTGRLWRSGTALAIAYAIRSRATPAGAEGGVA